MASPKRRTFGVRSRIALLLVIPVLSLIVLWAFTARVTLSDAVDTYRLQTVYDGVGDPGRALVTALQDERRLSGLHLAGGEGAGGPSHQRLMGARAAVDEAEVEFRAKALTDDVRDAADADARKLLGTFVQTLDALPEVRARVDSGAATPAEAVGGLSPIILAGLTAVNDLLISDTVRVYEKSEALVSFSWAREFILREDALVAPIAAAGTGRMTVAQHQDFGIWFMGHTQMTQMSIGRLGADLQQHGLAITQNPAYKRVTGLEIAIQRAVGAKKLPKEVIEGWEPAVTALLEVWDPQMDEAAAKLRAEADEITEGVYFRLWLAGGLGLLAVILSIVLSVLLSRGLARDIGNLQAAARDLAEHRLPWVIARLRRGEKVDLSELPEPGVESRTTEVAAVGDALGTVRRTALEAAVGEAHLRDGISRVFLNLAWRSQSLLHRQLRMLDALERRAPDPDTLNDLFQLDHLTTRMRRHAEGLIILSGAAPARAWSRPVHFADVLRGAVAEVEDYTRVEVSCNAPVALAGAAVTDVIHLLAELVENGTAYSPPPTEVFVHGEAVGNGFAIEIVDRGVGLSQEELAELNRRLIEVPDFDLADSDRLGLFVVSRLAARHGIRVTLQPSAYGGVTAIVLIPHRLVVPESQISDPLPASQMPALEQAAAPGEAPRTGPDGRYAPPRPTPGFPPQFTQDLPSDFQTGYQPGLPADPPPGFPADFRTEFPPEFPTGAQPTVQPDPGTGYPPGYGRPGEAEGRYTPESGRLMPEPPPAEPTANGHVVPPRPARSGDLPRRVRRRPAGGPEGRDGEV
ncbi:nitrate- and nitrite sensing domain-containing protein [Actinocorallia sp. A-T 12471]|uniref:sensor histidine kinase n=1 Tax=Actinocorallia sp. A-T 12471 TaxID=3089813 RepID=UPI0029D00F8D|nr:nitrate- and nitrite sensing domain-containing protein [Actinocorallia sp. A-T 12471]MDX6743290.1 nitrate- and nitrite sensing domain-containing protein [Actinocorallia sp. A-T 12471]